MVEARLAAVNTAATGFHPLNVAPGSRAALWTAIQGVAAGPNPFHEQAHLQQVTYNTSFITEIALDATVNQLDTDLLTERAALVYLAQQHEHLGTWEDLLATAYNSQIPSGQNETAMAMVSLAYFKQVNLQGMYLMHVFAHAIWSSSSQGHGRVAIYARTLNIQGDNSAYNDFFHAFGSLIWRRLMRNLPGVFASAGDKLTLADMAPLREDNVLPLEWAAFAGVSTSDGNDLLDNLEDFSFYIKMPPSFIPRDPTTGNVMEQAYCVIVMNHLIEQSNIANVDQTAAQLIDVLRTFLPSHGVTRTNPRLCPFIPGFYLYATTMHGHDDVRNAYMNRIVGTSHQAFVQFMENASRTSAYGSILSAAASQIATRGSRLAQGGAALIQREMKRISWCGRNWVHMRAVCDEITAGLENAPRDTFATFVNEKSIGGEVLAITTEQVVSALRIDVGQTEVVRQRLGIQQ